MSEWVRIKKSTLEGIGDAIREKEGSSDLIPTAEMKPRILAIKTGTGTYQVTDNGEYDITEYAKVNVNVASSGGEGNTLKKLLDHTKSCYYMFYQGSTITDLTDYFEPSATENVTNMSYMFSYCSALTAIPQLNTSNVTNMAYMFQTCKTLTTIPQLNTSKVVNMSSMFRGCTALTTIPPLNTKNVTDMGYTFSGTALTTIPQLDTSNVTNMAYMFQGCSALTTIPLLDTSNVTSMRSMFSNCKELTSIPQLNTSKVTSMREMFYGCWELEKIDLSYVNISSNSYTGQIFYNCYSLKTLIIRNFVNFTLNSNTFTNCYHLLGTVNETYNPNGDKDCYIYVPSTMVDTLKSATNWSEYADQIRALEDYTIDGTTTGELDESKI